MNIISYDFNCQPELTNDLLVEKMLTNLTKLEKLETLDTLDTLDLTPRSLEPIEPSSSNPSKRGSQANQANALTFSHLFSPFLLSFFVCAGLTSRHCGGKEEVG